MNKIEEQYSNSKLTIEDFKVVNAPGMIKLLSLADLGGLADLAEGDGITFNFLEINMEKKNETLKLNEVITASDSAFKVTLPDGTTTATSITSRFPLGSYIEIEGEIMRISSNSLSGSGDEISVIRGALGTISSAHPANSKIKKIKPIPIELRRPSILRASGHTFEYVGYGPGNYSTALPQLQNRSLSEREEFLTQSQETSCGNVVYTGMNDKGDFYIGNTKIASASGQQTTFDIPIPTITGEDPNRLSIVADEVIIKERLLVEGGSSKQILSQFDGPVTFNETVRLANQKTLNVTGEIKVASTGSIRVHNSNNATSSTTATGAIFTLGGVGIGKDIVIGGNIVGDGASNLSGFNNVTATAFFGDGAGLTNTGAQLSAATSGSERVVLTDKTSGTMTTAKTDPQLTFNFATNTLTSTAFAGALTGDVTGNADSATTSANLSFGSANQVVFKNGSNNGATSSALTFNGTQLNCTGNIRVSDITLGTISGVTTTSAALTFDGTQLNVTNNVRANNLTLGLTAGTTINTTTGDLVLDSSNNKVHITANAEVDGSMTIDSSTNSSSKDTGALVITAGGLGVEGNIFAGGDLVAFNSSDRNLKDNITIIPNALDKINAISGNTFTWKNHEDATMEGSDTGVIAQEVEALGLPGITTTRDSGFKAVNYDKLVPVLIQAVKELSAKVSALEGS